MRPLSKNESPSTAEGEASTQPLVGHGLGQRPGRKMDELADITVD